MGFIIPGVSFILGAALLLLLLMLLLVQKIGASKPSAFIVVMLLLSGFTLVSYSLLRAQATTGNEIIITLPLNKSINYSIPQYGATEQAVENQTINETNLNQTT